MAVSATFRRPAWMEPCVKRALDPDPDLRSEALKNVLTIAGLSALAGGTIRGLVGAPYLFGTQPSGSAGTALSPATVNIPYPVVVKKNRKPAPPMNVIKTSEVESQYNQIPWYYPLLMGASLPAFYGGYKGVDYLMDRYRKSQLQADEEQARREYEQALLEGYPAAHVPKVQSAPKLASEALLEEGAAALEKLAAQYVQATSAPPAAPPASGSAPTPVKQAFPSIPGLYGALATVLGLSSGALMYNYARDRSSSKLVQEAIRQRERQRWATRPPEVFAVPTPVKIVKEDPEENSTQVLPT